jgi:hypothetical protein
MSTAEFAEGYLGIELTQCQKDYMDYLDRHPDTKVTIPRGRGMITGYELWMLGYSLRFWSHNL